MHIENLSLINFKNYEKAALTFSPKINCLVGLNGSGKTNILDAIYYLSMTKSAHNSLDSQNIKFNMPYFSIKGTFFEKNSKDEIVCYYEQGSKKSFKVNKKDYDKLSEHVGKYPTVLITPNDTDIIRDGSETRRRFVDSILSQMDHGYLNALVKYNNNLKQRNSALKHFTKVNKVNEILIDTYDDKLIELGEVIFKKRQEFVQKFTPIFVDRYEYLSSGKENVNIEYESQFASPNPRGDLRSNRRKDLITERSNYGIHKDDYKLLIKENLVKKFGSQGQQKSVSIALKLAHFSIIYQNAKIKPILLLDDVFDKLDSERIEKLLKLVAGNEFDQIFITDAIEDRIESLLRDINMKTNYYLVANSTIEQKVLS